MENFYTVWALLIEHSWIPFEQVLNKSLFFIIKMQIRKNCRNRMAVIFEFKLGSVINKINYSKQMFFINLINVVQWEIVLYKIIRYLALVSNQK